MQVYFKGEDTDNDNGLWSTNGTWAGTFEVGGEKDAGVPGSYAYGLNPQDITAFNGKILFEGVDADGVDGLWISNGTTAGTLETGGFYDLGVKGAGNYGLQPEDIMTFGSHALFFGYDSDGDQELWVTDGTAAGTTELGGLGGAGIKGAYFNGLQANDFAALGTKEIFWGLDADDHEGLWVTTGTTNGTSEIGGFKDGKIKGWATSDSYPHGSNASFVVDGKLMFNAEDTSGHDGLWLTDGTLSGTSELGGLGNAAVSGARIDSLDLSGLSITVGKDVLFETSSGLWRTDGTAAGTTQIAPGGASSIALIGTKAIFAGESGLEVTNGTALGTYYVGGADNSGVKNIEPNDFYPRDLVSIGREVIFIGNDASNQSSLWITNGTAAGTNEIGGLDNKGVKGAPSGGIDPDSIVGSGSHAYFELYANGYESVWITDGTAAGTHSLKPGSVSYPTGFTSVTTPILSATAHAVTSDAFAHSLFEAAQDQAGHSDSTGTSVYYHTTVSPTSHDVLAGQALHASRG